MKKEKIFYRCMSRLRGDLPEHEIYFDLYCVEKETPKGYWIIRYYPDRKGFNLEFGVDSITKKFLLKKDGNKRFARDTKIRALEDFIYRKMYEIECCEARINNAKRCIEKAEEMLKIENVSKRLLKVEV